MVLSLLAVCHRWLSVVSTHSSRQTRRRRMRRGREPQSHWLIPGLIDDICTQRFSIASLHFSLRLNAKPKQRFPAFMNPAVYDACLLPSAFDGGMKGLPSMVLMATSA